MNPKYPVYIPTKGRWEARMTIKSMERLGVPYYAVVEPQEVDQYSAVIDKSLGTILVLPFSNLGQGAVPARNWIRKHSMEVLNAARHWQLDDNIRCFWRYHENRQIQVGDGTCFRVVEDFSDRYENVAISGMNYFMFIARKQKYPPFYLNHRVYSISLVNNSIPHWWRGKYNDDTDICLRAMKDGWCLVNFNQFLGQKMTTMTGKGGMTDLYKKAGGKDDGRLKMAMSLVEQHPDVTHITWKFSHWQHHVNYERFKDNKLKLRADAVIPDSDPYQMVLRNI